MVSFTSSYCLFVTEAILGNFWIRWLIFERGAKVQLKYEYWFYWAQYNMLSLLHFSPDHKFKINIALSLLMSSKPMELLEIVLSSFHLQKIFVWTSSFYTTKCIINNVFVFWLCYCRSIYRNSCWNTKIFWLVIVLVLTLSLLSLIGTGQLRVRLMMDSPVGWRESYQPY